MNITENTKSSNAMTIPIFLFVAHNFLIGIELKLLNI